MLIKQIIEFELRGPGPRGCTCNPKTGYFCDKTKVSKANLQANYYLLRKILRKAMHLASLHLDKVNYKIFQKMLTFEREL